jgi:hypothetical protein
MFKISMALFKVKKYVSMMLAITISVITTMGLPIAWRGVYDSLTQYVSYSFYDSTQKVQKDELITRRADYTMHLAKNETEACQIAFRMRMTKDVTVQLTDFKDENGNILESEIYEEYYVETTRDPYYGEYPDAIVPAEGKTLKMRKEKNKLFYISVKSKSDTHAGTYNANVILTGPEDRSSITVPVSAVVWNFTLPRTPSCQTAMGLDHHYIAEKFGVADDIEKTLRLYRKFYDFLVEHKISPYYLPVDILSDEADKYMSDPRITSFVIPYSNDDTLLQRYYAKVTSNRTWEAKGFFYPIDEPSDEEAYSRYLEITQRLERLCPGYNMATPFFKNKIDMGGEEQTSVNLQRGHSNIICPISELYDEQGFKESVLERKAQGDKSWWYVCCGPKGDYCNLFVHWEGIRHRILFWQQKDNNVDGLLYWSTSYWKDVEDIWESSWTTPWTGDDTFGDGSLLYNGNKVGIDGPVSSLRLEAVTDGIEDFEYLTIAQQLFGEEYVSNIIDKVTTSLTDYTMSDKTFANVRMELGNAINNEMNK